jgi:hypothetical protein
MAANVRLPVTAPRRLDESKQGWAAAEAHELLRRLALGAEPTPLRARAIAELASADAPSRIRDLGVILGDDATPMRLRQLAAVLLGRIDSERAREALLGALRVPDPALVGTVAQSLGRIGDRAAFEPIEKASAKLTGAPQSQARFALRLLAHRLNLALPDWPDEAVELSPRPGEAGATFRVTHPHPVEVQVASRSLACEPFGIELDESTAREVRCDGGSMMVLLNRGIDLDDAPAFLSRKLVFAIAGRKSEDSGLYAPALLFLTTPTTGGEGAALSAYQPNGALLLTGTAALQDDAVVFELRSVVRRGGMMLHVEGTLAGRDMAVTTAQIGCRRIGVGRPARAR